MHRTQIYFEESLFEQIRHEAKRMGISISAYIRNAIHRDLASSKSENKSHDLSEFVGMWHNRDITQDSIRKEAWR